MVELRKFDARIGSILADPGPLGARLDRYENRAGDCVLDDRIAMTGDNRRCGRGVFETNDELTGDELRRRPRRIRARARSGSGILLRVDKALNDNVGNDRRCHGHEQEASPETKGASFVGDHSFGWTQRFGHPTLIVSVASARLLYGFL